MTSASRQCFGTLPGGEAVQAVTLASRHSPVRARIITLGAALQSVEVPDRAGDVADILLGHRTLGEYLELRQYFGATVGRVANRIAGGRFTLDGRDHRVPINDGGNSLHGGACGFDQVNWRIVEQREDRVTLRHVSPDGDQGYPGTVAVTAVYSLGGDSLSVEYSARTDQPTLVNLSNHAYWNLRGEASSGSARDHILTIAADHFLPVDEGLIPTGEFRPVEGTPFDFRRPLPIAARLDVEDEQLRIGRGYDHCWAVAPAPSETPRLLARLEDPPSGRCLELSSNQPGLQFYSGNFLDGSSLGKAGRPYSKGQGIALEPQMFPDTPNRPAFGSIRLDPGETYRHLIIWRFPAA